MHPDITRIPPRARRYSYPPGARIGQTTSIQTRPQAKPRETGRVHWLLGFGLGMLIIVSILFIAEFVVIPTYRHLLDHWTYGEYPVSHIAADVGHGGKSDIYSFGVQNSAVVLVETRGKVEAYGVPLPGVNASSVVLVSVMDVNSDGKADLVIHTEDSSTSVVLFGTGKSFRDRP